MEMFGIMYRQREIVLLPFPFSDLSAVKKRPVLILSNNKFNEVSSDIIVVAITSKIFNDEYSIQIEDHDLEYALLPEKSVIKTSKLFTTSKSKIIKKFSILKNEKFYEVIKSLNFLFQSSD